MSREAVEMARCFKNKMNKKYPEDLVDIDWDANFGVKERNKQTEPETKPNSIEISYGHTTSVLATKSASDDSTKSASGFIASTVPITKSGKDYLVGLSWLEFDSLEEVQSSWSVHANRRAH
jgi:hypothetical protein